MKVFYFFFGIVFSASAFADNTSPILNIGLEGFFGSSYVETNSSSVKVRQLYNLAEKFAQEKNVLDRCDGEGCPDKAAQNAALVTEMCSEFYEEVKTDLKARDLADLPSGKSEMSSYFNVDQEKISALHESLLRQFRYSLEYFANNCEEENKEGTAGADQCLESIQHNGGSFKKACEDRMRVLLLAPVVDLDDRYAASLYNFGALSDHADEAGHDHDEEKGHSETRQTCPNGGSNCYFFQNEEFPEDCESVLKCSLGDEVFQENVGFSLLTSHFVNRELDDFQLKGRQSFCNDCLQKIYERENPQGDFEQEKRNYEAELKDNLAGKKAGKELLKLTRHLEALKDMSYLKPEMQSRNESVSCAEALEPLLTKNDCNNPNIGDSNYKKRLQKAFEFAEVPLGKQGSASDLIGYFNGAIDPKKDEKSCRKAYAFQKKFTIDNISNQKYKEALKELLAKVHSNDRFMGLLGEENCGPDANPKKSFIAQYASKMADGDLRILSEKIDSSFDKISSSIQNIQTDSAQAQRAVAAEMNNSDPEGDSASEDIRTMEVELKNIAADLVDGLDREEMSEEARDYFAGMNKKLEEMLHVFMAKEHHVKGLTSSDPNKREHTVEEFREYMRENLKSQIANTFYIPMSMDPAYKMALSDWKNVCQLYKSSQTTDRPVGDLIDEMENSDTEKRLDQYSSSTCASLKENLESALCSNEDMLTQNKNDKINFSKDDLDQARDDIVSSLSERSKIAASSLSCEINSQNENLGESASTHVNVFQSKSKTDIDEHYLATLSDYEKSLLKEKDARNPNIDVESDTYPDRDGGQGFSDFIAANPGCESQFLVEAVKMTGPQGSDVEPGGIHDWLSSAFPGSGSAGGSDYQTHQNYRKNSDEPAPPPVYPTVLKPSSPGVFGHRSSNLSESSERGTTASYPASGRETVSLSDETEKGGISTFDKIFGKQENDGQPESDVPSGYLPGGTTTPSFAGTEEPPGVARAPASTRATAADGSNAAVTPGPAQSLAEEIKSGEEVADGVELGRLMERTEQLMKENQELREEMGAVKAKLEEKAETQIRTGDGENDVITAPQSPSQFAERKDLVFNPRNRQGNEFVSRSHMENQREQFAPDYSENSTPERISLGEYASQRRNAARVPVDSVKNYNTDIDRAFLQAHSSSPVDDNFVKEYVEHVDRSSGSIEHLIVFENGRPAKIRIPDPRREGRYLEHPIAEEMVAEILEKVEQDEQESFALYNMVNFGQSLQDFMQHLDGEQVSLRSLEARLEEMDQQFGN